MVRYLTVSRSVDVDPSILHLRQMLLMPSPPPRLSHPGFTQEHHAASCVAGHKSRPAESSQIDVFPEGDGTVIIQSNH